MRVVIELSSKHLLRVGPSFPFEEERPQPVSCGKGQRLRFVVGQAVLKLNGLL